jgi:uncharacterized protein
MRSHCTALTAAIFWLAAGAASAQQASPAASLSPGTGEAVFNVYVRGAHAGRQQDSVSRSGSGWVITSSGGLDAPIDLAIDRFEIKYAQDWQPLELKLEMRLRTTAVALSTSFTLTNAVNDITQNDRTTGKQDQVSARTIVLPNNIFGSYEALAVRLSASKAGDELPIYIAPQGEIKLTVRRMSNATLTGPSWSLPIRTYEVTFQNPGKPLEASVTIDEHLRLVRFELPSASLVVVREDASGVAVRTQPERNPTDVDVRIPANGFQLAGTLTTPPNVAGRLKYPAIVLLGGMIPSDREEVIAGVPVFTQLARALAESGHIVLRYDRRGVGQSGGRVESVTLGDWAEDALSAVKWLQKRADVDRRHIILCGRGPAGAAVALVAASREKDVAGVVVIDGSGVKGSDLVLEQQERVLEKLNLPPAERESRIALQKKIDDAVVSGRGWEGIPEAMRRQADVPWFKSLLAYDPHETVPKVRQPLLIVQADLDPEVARNDADRLAELAHSRKKGGPAEIVHLPEANQALVSQPAGLVTPKVAAAIADWIKKL